MRWYNFETNQLMKKQNSHYCIEIDPCIFNELDKT